MAVATEAIAQNVLVRFEPGTSASERAEAREDAGASFEASLPLRGLQLVAPDEGRTAAGVAAGLERSDEVMYAEPDAARRAFVFPDDTLGDLLWGLRNTGGGGGTADADIDADEAWGVTTGDAAVSVGIIDSGISFSHPDLAPNIRENPGESGPYSTNGIDDDLNGYVDDRHGWDWVADDNEPADENGHGTHVSGTVGARGNDAAGVMGVAWHAGLTPLRVLNAGGSGLVSDVIAAYGYAREQGLRIVNASIGGAPFSLAERDAIAAASDTLFVVAAGNGGSDQAGDDNDVQPTYPCAYDLPNLICVAATDRNDALASFSNYGDASVDLAAPGVGIVSTIPSAGWDYASGTSMASPHVAGAAALVWSEYPAATVAGVRAALLQSVDAKPGLAGKTVTGGRLNAFRALGGIPTIPASAPAKQVTTPSTLPPPLLTTIPTVAARRLAIAVALRGRLLLGRGVRVRTRCSVACRVTHELRRGSRVVARARGRLSRAGYVTVRLRLTAAARRRLRHARNVRLTLRTRAVDGSGRVRIARRSVRLHRR
ncbi:MAG: S8 family serine peptidase [Thermoleophilaceae bacterium]|nr:S8 family serine peptidase [Thermoleophilaceae bacterium]